MTPAEILAEATNGNAPDNETWELSTLDLRALVEHVRREAEPLRRLAEKVNAIRNSIVGTQSLSWSAHAYPLVAALEEAGIKGEGYERAREKMRAALDAEGRAQAQAIAASAEKAVAEERERCARAVEINLSNTYAAARIAELIREGR